MFCAAPIFGATLLHRYSFASDASDSVGGAHGTLQGGALITDGVVLFDALSAYVDLPNGMLSTLSNVTIEVWVTDNGSGTWSRIFDFGNSSGGEAPPGTGMEYLFLTPQSGAGTLRGAITIASNGAEQGLEWPGTRLPIGELKHVVWTSDAATQTGRLFVDGELVNENPAMTVRPMDMGWTLNHWIGRSQWAGDAYFYGYVTEFRIYDGALTADQVRTNFANGPDVALGVGPVEFLLQPISQSVAELAPVTFSTTFRGSLPVGIQWRRNGVNIPGATNDTYSLLATLANQSDAFGVVLTNAHLGAPASVTSTNAVLTVIADHTDPQLASAASLFPQPGSCHVLRRHQRRHSHERGELHHHPRRRHAGGKRGAIWFVERGNRADDGGAIAGHALHAHGGEPARPVCGRKPDRAGQSDGIRGGGLCGGEHRKSGDWRHAGGRARRVGPDGSGGGHRRRERSVHIQLPGLHQ